MHPLSLLLILILIITWTRLFRPVRRGVQGTMILVMPLPLLAKIRMHSIPSALSLALAIGLAATDNVPWWTLALPILSTVLLLVIPVQYTLTDVGIRLGWTEFRRWTEFTGVRRTRFGARLLGLSGKRGLAIWLSGSRGDDEFIHFLRQTLKNAYKGNASSPAVDADRTLVAAHRPDVPQAQIAAFTRSDQM
jgi:hypothetical protein